MASESVKVEQILGVVGFIDGGLDNILPEQESQYVGLFRVSPDEVEYRELEKSLKPIDSHFIMRAALEAEDKRNSIICASKFLKSLLASLERPLIPMSYALEPFDHGDETDSSVIAAMLADSYLQCIAKNHPNESAVAWATAGAQLFALLCHVSRTPLTKMDEYSLAVVFLPSLTSNRSVKPEDLMAEQQQIMKFQKGHRDGDQPTRIEALIKYGRRIWGAIYDTIPSLQYELDEMARAFKAASSTSGSRKRDKVLRFLEKAAQPITGRLHRSSENSAAPGYRRPSIITRAFSMDGRNGQSLVASGGPPSSSLDSTFIGNAPPQASARVPPPPPPRTLKLTSSTSPNLNSPMVSSVSSGELPIPRRAPLPVPSRDANEDVAQLPVTKRSVSNGSDGMSSQVKLAAHNSAVKRRLSRDIQAVPPPPSVRMGSTGNIESSDTLFERPSSGTFSRQDSQGSGSHLERPLSGRFARQGSQGSVSSGTLGSSRRFSNRDDLNSNSGYGSFRRSTEVAPLAAAGSFKKDRQPSLGDIGRQIIQSIDSDLVKPGSNLSPIPSTEKRYSTSPLVERDSDLL